MRPKPPEAIRNFICFGLLSVGLAACGGSAGSSNNERFAGRYRDTHGSYSATGIGDNICPPSAPRPDGSFPGEPPGNLLVCKTGTDSE